MRRTLVGTILGLALVTASPAKVAAQVLDTTPPVLTAFDFEPKAIDTTAGSATVTATYSATDDLSGAYGFEVVFVSPSGSGRLAQSWSCSGLSCTASAVVGFGQYNTEAGAWTVAHVWVTDPVGNYRTYDTAALAAMGFPTGLSVAAGPMDTNAPVLTAFDFEPKAIDTSAGPATVTATYSATDDVSGAYGFEVVFVSPSGAGRVAQSWSCSGLSCTASAVVGFGQYDTEPGVWTVAHVWVTDPVGNYRTYDTASLAAMGFPLYLLNTSQTVSELVPLNGGGTVDGKVGKRNSVSLWARLQNVGPKAAANVQVSFEWSADGGNTYTRIGGAVRVGNLASGAIGIATARFLALPGHYVIRATVDAADRVAEYAEHNNVLTFPLIVP